jgi:hypothetical protein
LVNKSGKKQQSTCSDFSESDLIFFLEPWVSPWFLALGFSRLGVGSSLGAGHASWLEGCLKAVAIVEVSDFLEHLEQTAAHWCRGYCFPEGTLNASSF